MISQIRLTNGMTALCDTEDFARLSQHRWHFSKSTHGEGGYAVARIDGRQTSMHRFVINAPKGKQVDHWNRHKLDNRKVNLRLCTNSENHANSPCRTASGYKGVYFDTEKKAKQWRASITVDNRVRHLARCATAEDAAIYYDVAAQLFFGPFARTNGI